MAKFKRNEHIKALRKEGLSYIKIGKIIGISREWARKIAKGLNVRLDPLLPRPSQKCYACNSIFSPIGHARKYCYNCSDNLKILNGRERTREIVRIRDNHTCQNCRLIWDENMRKFDVHHLNGKCGKLTKKYDKASDLSGMVTLCHRCHFNHPQHSYKINQRYHHMKHETHKSIPAKGRGH